MYEGVPGRVLSTPGGSPGLLAEYFDSYGDHLPQGIKEEHRALAARLKA